MCISRTDSKALGIAIAESEAPKAAFRCAAAPLTSGLACPDGLSLLWRASWRAACAACAAWRHLGLASRGLQRQTQRGEVAAVAARALQCVLEGGPPSSDILTALEASRLAAASRCLRAAAAAPFPSLERSCRQLKASAAAAGGWQSGGFLARLPRAACQRALGEYAIGIANAPVESQVLHCRLDMLASGGSVRQLAPVGNHCRGFECGSLRWQVCLKSRRSVWFVGVTCLGPATPAPKHWDHQAELYKFLGGKSGLRLEVRLLYAGTSEEEAAALDLPASSSLILRPIRIKCISTGRERVVDLFSQPEAFVEKHWHAVSRGGVVTVDSKEVAHGAFEDDDLCVRWPLADSVALSAGAESVAGISFRVLDASFGSIGSKLRAIPEVDEF